MERDCDAIIWGLESLQIVIHINHVSCQHFVPLTVKRNFPFCVTLTVISMRQQSAYVLQHAVVKLYILMKRSTCLSC